MIKVDMNKKHTGFTLVELLVVIGIMSILTVVSVSQFNTASKRGRDTQRKGDLSALSKALLAYYADQGVFPPEASVDIITGTGELKSLSGDYVYMKVLPKENYKEQLKMPDYCYVIDSTGQKFGLFAQLEVETDKDCEGHDYSFCGETYCFGTVSPNTVVSELYEMRLH